MSTMSPVDASTDSGEDRLPGRRSTFAEGLRLWIANVKAGEIRWRSQLGITMMPAGLTTAEFTSLIEYLVSLKEKK